MSENFTVATFNCNSIRQRLEPIVEWLAFNDPDILCLQETKVQDKDFPAGEFEDMGYHVVFRGMKSYNGVAMVCRDAPVEVAFGFDDEGASDAALGAQDAARLIRARFDDGLTVVNTYVPQGFAIDSPKYRHKLEWFRRLKALFARHLSPEAPALWTGDINVAPEDADVHSPETHREHVCFHADAREAFRDVCDFGFVDVFRKHRPDAGEFTFWDYRANSFATNKGWRIDHLLATPALADRSVDAYVDREPRAGERPSDHTFLVGVFGK